MKSHQVRMV